MVSKLIAKLSSESDVPKTEVFSSSEVDSLIEKAELIYNQNFPATTCFERAIFFSWGCTIGDCTFCYMSTQPAEKKPTETKRSTESILAEFILAKNLGWDIGFFTGGIGVFTPSEIEFLLKSAVEITEEKIWLSVGALSTPLIKKYLPYIKGVVGSTETINPILHKIVCPSKPLQPYEKMFVESKKLNLLTAMTFIVGMGEVKSDLTLLIDFIRKYEIDKIHVYGLIPQEGTMFQSHEPPTKEAQAWWIAQLRIACPKLDIQCGVWEDRMNRVSYLLKAGANSVSKFRATALFATPVARELEIQAKIAGRKFQGTLTVLPEIDWTEEVNKIHFDSELKKNILKKLNEYLAVMKRNLAKNK
ncbi:radical SAM protein [Candidatus Woesearchaeota archaeon]|nr:radical SAM protein [Candidatus Woesearchaeota archaeon]